MCDQRRRLAKYAWALQPATIRHRLAANQSFVTDYGPFFTTMVTYGQIGPIDQDNLFGAARRAFNGSEEKILDGQNREITITGSERGVILRLTEAAKEEVEVCDENLCVLSPHCETRLRAIDELIARLGPTAPDYTGLRDAAKNRQLDDREAATLLAEALQGVVGRQARAAAAVQGGDVAVDDVVPSELSYFEHLCGPSPDDYDQDVYFKSILPKFRTNLLRRNLVGGLDICLMGSLRDDLVPAQWMADVTNNMLWDALATCDPGRDPFSLLGALDLAMNRYSDARFRKFAEDAVAKLCSNTFLRPDGIDVYQLLPLFAQLVTDQLNTYKNGVLRPPYWKRMCAYMHATVLHRLTLSIHLDFEGVRNWIQGRRTPAMVYARLLDMRYEPMYQSGNFSAAALRGEVLGRLNRLRLRYQAMGTTIPGAEEIESSLQCELYVPMPGPLEGQRPALQGKEIKTLLELEAQRVLDDLRLSPTGTGWALLAYLSQSCELGDDLLAQINEISKSIKAREKDGDLPSLLESLSNGCLLAAGQRHTELASTLAAVIVESSQNVRRSEEAQHILQNLLIASTAFEEQRAWASWLEERLAGVAQRLPVGEVTSSLLEHLMELKKVLPMTAGVLSRAEAYLRAAQ